MSSFDGLKAVAWCQLYDCSVKEPKLQKKCNKVSNRRECLHCEYHSVEFKPRKEAITE